MAEPIVHELMRADHVDPAAFEALLRSIRKIAPPHCTVRSLARSFMVPTAAVDRNAAFGRWGVRSRIPISNQNYTGDGGPTRCGQ